MRTISKAVSVENTVLTIPVSDAVRGVIAQWSRDHIEDLNRRLEPYDLSAFDLTEPHYSRVVTKEDLA